MNGKNNVLFRRKFDGKNFTILRNQDGWPVVGDKSTAESLAEIQRATGHYAHVHHQSDGSKEHPGYHGWVVYIRRK